MAITKTLIYVFIAFYIGVLIYLLAFFQIPEFKNFIIAARGLYVNLTEGGNYIWALFIVFIVCLIGSASIGFPIPYPFILFTLSNSVLRKYGNMGLMLEEILVNGGFWIEIFGFIIIGGLGSAIGELSGYAVGFSTKKLWEDSNSEALKNFNAFGKLILENEKRAPFYIFIFALTPLPDDILFLPLGMLKYPWYKAIIPGWLGKSVITLFYCVWPILLQVGLLEIGLELNAELDIITEGISLLLTISVMFFIFSFNWDRFLMKRRESKNVITN
jgi:hypothetical protein